MARTPATATRCRPPGARTRALNGSSGAALLGSLLAAATTAGSVEVPPPARILERLRDTRPRLIALPERLDRLRESLRSEPLLQRWHGELQGSARRILESRLPAYEIPDGLRLLSTSRRVLHHVTTLALLFHLDGDRRYVERAARELDTAARFPDWNPRHFLDTAEMTCAFALGLDWLHDQWRPEERARLSRAIVEKGLEPALAAYAGRSPHGWWTEAVHNWNQVTNGGIAIGALAVAGEEPEIAAKVLHEALSRLPRAMKRFAPDGAWDEGPGYWRYATEYNVLVLAALETALGTDFGLSAIDGFAEAGLFPIYLTGSSGQTFNFADGGSGTIQAPQLLWLARRFDRPLYAQAQVRVAAPHPLDLLWVDPRTAREGARPPLDRYFRGAEVATFRTAWDDPGALFLAFKGGSNQANHGHLDLGTFVLDALGERWALDLGADDYNLPGYWDRGREGRRWRYYRLRAEGHNTLVIDPGPGPDQDPLAEARISQFHSTPAGGSAVCDLTPAYRSAARRVRRGVRLLRSEGPPRVLVQDEVEAARPAPLWWFLHSGAEVRLGAEGREAILAQGGRELLARVLAPREARFQVLAAEPLPSSPRPEGQRVNRGVRRLAIPLDLDLETPLRLAVELVPRRQGEELPESSAVAPLERWEASP